MQFTEIICTMIITNQKVPVVSLIQCRITLHYSNRFFYGFKQNIPLDPRFFQLRKIRKNISDMLRSPNSISDWEGLLVAIFFFCGHLFGSELWINIKPAKPIMTKREPFFSWSKPFSIYKKSPNSLVKMFL